MKFEFDTRMLDERRFVDFHFYSVVLSKPLPRPHPIAVLQNYITELILTLTRKSALYTSKIKLPYLPSGKHAMLLTLRALFSFIFHVYLQIKLSL